MPSKQLTVVFDTNAIWTESTSLVRKEVEDLIREFTNHPQVALTWYLPEVVRLERIHQMRKKWHDVLHRAKALEDFLGKLLGISEEVINKKVEKLVSDRQAELGLVTLPLRNEAADITSIMRTAAERRPPFNPDGEKGFRDALILACIAGLMRPRKDEPLVLVSGDELMAKAVAAGDKSVRVVENTDGVRGILAALLDDVDESFIAPHRARAEALFSQSIYKQHRIPDRLEEKFKSELATYPKGSLGRRNTSWWIFKPTFVRKKQERLHWLSRVARDAEAWVLTKVQDADMQEASKELASKIDQDTPGWLVALGAAAGALMSLQRSLKVVQKGSAVFHVAWSASVEGDQLVKPSVDELIYKGTSWEPVE